MNNQYDQYQHHGCDPFLQEQPRHDDHEPFIEDVPFSPSSPNIEYLQRQLETYNEDASELHLHTAFLDRDDPDCADELLSCDKAIANLMQAISLTEHLIQREEAKMNGDAS